ncbi:FIST C-terminal domain-containing protein [Azospirillum sp. YIM DDC1]|uniref:FIST C-terminal domain-containing protein n=1 Tax=Azospirillum aestuarii TaxID=2802052 RepID=A0ABS1HVZ5_9PROT|nr:FIST N-terminal domain-containing protein [Azospirillum aestuarii]MBK4719009.1 FIST C-terminal domain-containing protein [Azospirillum aestuarii]
MATLAGDTATTETFFKAASASGTEWGAVVKSCLDELGAVEGCNLGFLYITDALAEHATSMVTLLRGVTGIRDWVGTVGIGVCANDEEIFDKPGIAVMVARLPPEGFRLFPVVSGDMEPLRRMAGGWLDKHGAMLALAHADPRHQDLAGLVVSLAETTGAFLVGGLSASRSEFPQFTIPGNTATMVGGPVAEGGVSGVLFAPQVPVATGLSQGCTPIGPVRTITAAEDNVVLEIDGRPALEVFKEDIGELLARDLKRVSGYIFAGLPIAGSDTADYLVRDLIAIDPRAGWIAVAHHVQSGQPILFTRRDQQSAEADMRRMLANLKKRVKTTPKGALYVSCIARGPSLFGEGSQELALIRETFGDIPLAGFFASGEISNARLYGYTGVLTLFL